MTEHEQAAYLDDLMRRRLRTATLGAEIPPDTPIDGPRGLFVYACLVYHDAGTLTDKELAAGILAVRTADDEALEALLTQLQAIDDERKALLAQAWTERRQQYEHDRDKWSDAHLN